MDQPTVPGFRYIANFIQAKDERKLLRFLDSQQWVHDFSSRRIQQYGYKLDFFNDNELTYIGPIPQEFSKLMARMERAGIIPVSQCQQIIVNEYVGPKQGIGKHVDCDVFGETIVSVSLGDSCVLHMHETISQEKYDFKTLEQTGTVAAFLVEPCSVFVLEKDARWVWKHEIPKSDKVPINGDFLTRGEDYRRVSLTFRGIVENDRRIVDGPLKACPKETCDRPSTV